MKDSSSSPDHDIFFKCVLLGPPGVGKTCLLNRLATGKFLDCPLSTLTTSSLLISLPLPGGAAASMDLWDTGGQERYRSLTANYFRDAKAVLLVYDSESKTKIGDWLMEARRHVTGHEALLFLIGAKLDLGSDITLNDVQMRALGQLVGGGEREIEDHFALSAKTGENVSETFARIAECVWRAGRDSRVDLSRRRDTLRISKESRHRFRISLCCF